MPTPRVEVDVKALDAAVRAELFRRDLSARRLSQQLGLSPMALTDLKQAARGTGRSKDYRPSAALLLTLSWWLARDPRDFEAARGE